MGGFAGATGEAAAVTILQDVPVASLAGPKPRIAVPASAEHLAIDHHREEE
jgi:hypothetical protein